MVCGNLPYVPVFVMGLASAYAECIIVIHAFFTMHSIMRYEV